VYARKRLILFTSKAPNTPIKRDAIAGITTKGAQRERLGNNRSVTAIIANFTTTAKKPVTGAGAPS